jgi:hypothetical protein
MKLPTKEQIVARADYLYGELCDKMMDEGSSFKEERSGAQRRALIAELLTAQIYEHGGMLDKSSISVRRDNVNPGMGIIRVSTRSHRYDHDVVLPIVY